jgi:hypothetical protein
MELYRAIKNVSNVFNGIRKFSQYTEIKKIYNYIYSMTPILLIYKCKIYTFAYKRLGEIHKNVIRCYFWVAKL